LGYLIFLTKLLLVIRITYVSEEIGQAIFNPVDVAGWPGQRSWMNESTLTLRWSFMQTIIFEFMNNDVTRLKLRDLAITLSDTSSDPVYITQVFANHFLNTELSPDNLESAVQYFKGEVPQNYFEDGTWSLYFAGVDC